MTTKENFEALIQKYREGNCTEHEEQQLENWLNKEAGIHPDREFPQDFWQKKEARLQQILGFDPRTEKKCSLINWPMNILFIAAAIAIVGTISTLVLKKTMPAPMRFAADINPGGNKAILTLQNGKTIQLSDARAGIIIDASKLTYDDGTLINNEPTQVFTIFSTPNGGTYQIRLPDGSMVWLNAASSLTYHPALKGQQYSRNIDLSGEAYFEVAKDKSHPFVVTTAWQRIEVLGTHFNVSAYNDEFSVKTTLLEGSVKVRPMTSEVGVTKEIILKPNQQSEVTVNGISVHQIDPALIIAWKNGEFIFVDEKLESIMRKIARWYNVEVVYTDKKIANRTFSGVVSKYEKASQMLCLLEATGNVKFTIEGRRIMVKP